MGCIGACLGQYKKLVSSGIGTFSHEESFWKSFSDNSTTFPILQRYVNNVECKDYATICSMQNIWSYNRVKMMVLLLLPWLPQWVWPATEIDLTKLSTATIKLKLLNALSYNCCGNCVQFLLQTSFQFFLHTSLFSFPYESVVKHLGLNDFLATGMCGCHCELHGCWSTTSMFRWCDALAQGKGSRGTVGSNSDFSAWEILQPNRGKKRGGGCGDVGER